MGEAQKPKLAGHEHLPLAVMAELFKAYPGSTYHHPTPFSDQSLPESGAQENGSCGMSMVETFQNNAYK